MCILHDTHNTFEDVEFLDRANEILSEESGEQVAWWWLSFCDVTKPEGQQFIGACLVKATGFLGATIEARRLKCNPGGEVQGMGPMPLEANPAKEFTERLLTKAEVEEFDRIMEKRDSENPS